jgi:hypothetical protein
MEEKMSDKVIISGGYGCDMSYTVVGENLPAFVHLVNGRWVFDVVKFWSWYQPLSFEGMAGHKMWLYCAGGGLPEGGRGVLLRPWPYVPAKDAWQFFHIEVIGKDTNGKDITKVVYDFNEDFFIVLRQMCEEQNKMLIVPDIAVADECQGHGAGRQVGSPFYVNVNGIKDVYDPKALPVYAALTKKLLATLQAPSKDFPNGVKFGIEMGNEIVSKGGVEVAAAIWPELLAADVKPWDISLGADMIQCKYQPATKTYVCAHDFENQEYIAKEGERLYEPKYGGMVRNQFWRPVHDCGRPPDFKDRPFGELYHQAKDWWILHIAASARIIFGTDGANPRPDAKTMKAMMLDALTSCPKNTNYMVGGRPKFRFDFLPDKESIPEVALVIRAMAEAYHEFFGVWPENRGKVPPYSGPVPIPPTPIPTPTPTPEPGPVTPTPGGKKIPFSWRGMLSNWWKFYKPELISLGVVVIASIIWGWWILPVGIAAIAAYRWRAMLKNLLSRKP